MDFSNYFKVRIMDPTNIIIPLLGFNIRIELGQLLIVFFIVGIAFLFLNILKVKHGEWNILFPEQQRECH
ncbi:HupE/UreJ family protein [Flagellimonas sp. 389]|nr:HupE/UreJ family protein [Flagellimonas sp. 389]